jgi:hypothetical protein
LADRLPFFPDLKTAILRMGYQAKDPGKFQNSSLGQFVIVRSADSSAWLNQITLSPISIKVNVAGTRVTGSQLTISGSGGVQFQEQLLKRATIECPLPNGVPSPLWIALSRGDQWLDYYHRDERWPITNQTHANVTIEAGDTSTEIAGIIAQGEGLTTEFKEDVPKERDQLLKTVAAFANGECGVILLGVKDSSGELVGFAGQIDDLTQMIRDNVFPEPTVRITAVEVERRRIVTIYVQKGASVPYGLQEINTRYYVRRGATTFPARPEELRAIVLSRQPSAQGPFAGYVT